MKKFKFLPTLLMLVLCGGVLAVGIYAAGTTTNDITGTITINAGNLPFGLKAYKWDAEKGDWATTPFFNQPEIRGGYTIDLGTDLAFNLDSVNSESQLNSLDIEIKFVLTNPNDVNLSAYFSNTENGSAETEKQLTTEGGNKTAVKAVYPATTTINAKSGSTNGTNEFVLTFRISEFIESD